NVWRTGTFGSPAAESRALWYLQPRLPASTYSPRKPLHPTTQGKKLSAACRSFSTHQVANLPAGCTISCRELSEHAPSGPILRRRPREFTRCTDCPRGLLRHAFLDREGSGKIAKFLRRHPRRERGQAGKSLLHQALQLMDYSQFRWRPDARQARSDPRNSSGSEPCEQLHQSARRRHLQRHYLFPIPAPPIMYMSQLWSA